MVAKLVHDGHQLNFLDETGKCTGFLRIGKDKERESEFLETWRIIPEGQGEGYYLGVKYSTSHDVMEMFRQLSRFLEKNDVGYLPKNPVVKSPEEKS